MVSSIHNLQQYSWTDGIQYSKSSAVFMDGLYPASVFFSRIQGSSIQAELLIACKYDKELY